MLITRMGVIFSRGTEQFVWWNSSIWMVLNVRIFTHIMRLVRLACSISATAPPRSVRHPLRQADLTRWVRGTLTLALQSSVQIVTPLCLEVMTVSMSLVVLKYLLDLFSWFMYAKLCHCQYIAFLSRLCFSCLIPKYVDHPCKMICSSDELDSAHRERASWAHSSSLSE